MNVVRTRRLAACAVISLSVIAQAWADLSVSIEIVDANGDPVAAASAGDSAFADVFLAVDPADAPLNDVRLIQLDTRSSSQGVVIDGIEWRLEDAGVDNTLLYFFDESPSGVFRANYLQAQPEAGFILSLNSVPRRVARLSVTFNDSGDVDVTGRGVATPGASDEGLRVQAGFDAPTTYAQSDGDVAGGASHVEVSGGGGADNANANDNVNTNLNEGALPPPTSNRLCGLSFGSTAALTALALGLMPRRRRRR